MSERYETEHTRWWTIESGGNDGINDSDDGDDLPSIVDQIDALRGQMLENRSPGAKLIIRHMEALDRAMSELSDGLDQFHPEGHHSRYAADQVTRRYIFLGSQYLQWRLNYVSEMIGERVSGFHLTDVNTRPVQEPEYMTQRRKYLRRQALMERRYRRSERIATLRMRAVSPKAAD